MSLLNIPNEVLILIAKELDEKSLSHLICTNRHLHAILIKLLHHLALQDKDNMPALFWAALKGHAPLIELVLDDTLEVNLNKFLVTKEGAQFPNVEPINHDEYSTALRIAAFNSRVEAVEILLQRGALVNLPDFFGSTALMAAISGVADMDVITKLLDYCENIDAVDIIYYRTAFFWALIEGKKEAMKLLFDRGANIDVVDIFNNTPLTYAIETGQLDLIELLVSMGASLEANYSSGWTPLSDAIRVENLDVIRLLLKHGANPNTIHAEAWLCKSDEVQTLITEVLLEHL